MKIKRRECKSLKEFNKIYRKYIKYFKNNHIYHNYWYTWIWYDVIGLDSINNLIPHAIKLANQNHLNLLSIINTVKKNYNWSYVHKDGRVYYLQGIEISNEDYYYIYLSEDGHKQYNSCVGRFDDVDYYQRQKK